MRYISILLLIVPILFISGCIGQTPTGTSTNDGIVITDFSFQNTPIYAEENVGLNLEVQNVGSSEARLKRIQVYGVDFSPSDIDWRVKNNDNDLRLNEELYQPDPGINLDGEKYFYEWMLKAPSKVLASTKYDFVARVEYEYITTYTGTIRLVNDNYLQSLSDEERNKLYNSDGIVSSKTTNGPISVTPFSGRHFIVTGAISPGGEGGEFNQPRAIRFKIENIGKGYPYICPIGIDCVSDDSSANKSYLRVKTMGDFVSCSVNEIKLSTGKSHVIDCNFSPSSVENKVDKTFQIELSYSYYVDFYTSITVKPAR